MIDLELATNFTRALHGDNDDEVIELCRKAGDEASLLPYTLHGDTVIQQACYMKKFQLAHQLFDRVPERLNSLLYHQNAWGNTLFHNCFVEFMSSKSNPHPDEEIKLAKKLLQKAPQLLVMHNNWGESAVIQAVRHGGRRYFEYLAEEVDKYCESHKEVNHMHFFQRADKTTILHMSILTGNFDLALGIAKRYPDLCNVQNQNGMTAFQILACNPTAFRSGTELGFLKRLIYSRVSTYEREDSDSKIQKALSFILDSGKSGWILPMIENIRGIKRGHEAVLKLTKVLARHDTSCLNSHKPGAELMPVINAHNNPAYKSSRMGYPSKSLNNEVKVETSMLDLAKSYGTEEPEGSTYEHKGRDLERCKTFHPSSIISSFNVTPMFLAARKGCTEIVEEILNVHPQGYEYIDQDGMNVLHVAIRYRHLSIMRLIESRFHFQNMIYNLDKRGNSVLHMVGFREEVYLDAKMRSPVIELTDDLLLLEYLKKICPSCLVYHRNDEMMTADELFAVNNQKLRNEGKEWLKRTAEHCTVVIVLIATVAFAAAYTVPGGPNQETGVPLLVSHPFFVVFTMTDVLSLGFGLTAVIVFLSILTSSFQLKDFRRSLPQKLLLGFTLLFLSVSMMMVSFAATIILTIRSGERWTKIAVYIVAFFPVSIFVLSYIPLYLQLIETFKYWIKRIGKLLPRCAPTTCFTSSNIQSTGSFTSSSTHYAADSV